MPPPRSQVPRSLVGNALFATSSGQNTRSTGRQGMMDARYGRQQVGSAVDVRDRPGQSRTAAAELVFGRRKPYPEGALAGPIALIRSRTIHARRDRKRQTPWDESGSNWSGRRAMRSRSSRTSSGPNRSGHSSLPKPRSSAYGSFEKLQPSSRPERFWLSTGS